MDLIKVPFLVPIGSTPYTDKIDIEIIKPDTKIKLIKSFKIKEFKALFQIIHNRNIAIIAIVDIAILLEKFIKNKG